MSDIKAGDFVRRTNKVTFNEVKYGDVVRVKEVAQNGSVLWVEGKSSTHCVSSYTKIKFSIKDDSWFIRVSKDTLPLVHQWLKDQGLNVALPNAYGIKYLTNTIKGGGVQSKLMWGLRDDIHTYAKEIKLNFAIVAVEFPEPPALTAEELELIELRKQLETISERMKQLEK